MIKCIRTKRVRPFCMFLKFMTNWRVAMHMTVLHMTVLRILAILENFCTEERKTKQNPRTLCNAG